MYRAFIIYSLVLSFAFASSAQNTFQKIYTSPYDVYCFGAYQGSDGSYIITGVAQVSATAYNIYMTRTDCHGEILWSKMYNSSSTVGNISQRVIETHDHGYLLAASIGSYGAYNILLVRTDANGNALWKKMMQGTGDDLVNSVIETSSHDFILAGSTSSYGQDAGTFYKDVYLAKVDGDGNFIWGKTFGTAGSYDEGYDIVQSNDGDYAVTGRYIVSGAFHCFLMKTDTAGSMLFMKAYGDTLQDVTGYAIANTLDGGFVITGSSTLTKSSFLDFPDEFLIKTNSEGDTLWCKSYHGSNTDGSENGSSVVPLNDGTYAIGVATFSYPTIGFVPNKHCIVKTDGDGNLQWAKTYNDGGSHYPYLTAAKGENGFVLSGFSNFYTPSFSPMIIKMDDNFNSGCNETDVTNLTFQEHMPAKVKTPTVLFASGGSLINTSVENDFVMNDTVLCSSFTDSCFVFTTLQELPKPFAIPSIYPNPASDWVNLELFSDKQQNATIEIFDDLGTLVLSINHDLSSGRNIVPVDVSQLSQGIFMVRVKTGEKFSSIKFIKE